MGHMIWLYAERVSAVGAQQSNIQAQAYTKSVLQIPIYHEPIELSECERFE